MKYYRRTSHYRITSYYRVFSIWVESFNDGRWIYLDTTLEELKARVLSWKDKLVEITKEECETELMMQELSK